MRDVLRGIGAILQASWRADPRRLLTSIVLMILGAVSLPLIAVVLGATVEAVLDGNVPRAVLTTVLLAVFAMTALTMEHFAHIFFFELADLNQLRAEAEMGDLSHGPPGVEHLESRDFADRLDLLRRESGSIGEGVRTLLAAGALLIQILMTAVLLASLQPWLLVLALFALAPLLAGRLADRLRERAELAEAQRTRLGWHLLDVAVSPTAAKEVRTFGMQRALRRRYARLSAETDARLARADLAGTLLRIVGQLVYAAGYVAAVVLVVRSALAGNRSIGEVVLVVTLAVQTNTQAAVAVAVAQSLQRNARATALLQWLREASRRATAQVEARGTPPPVLTRGIDFDGVAFRYPGSDRDVLLDVTLRIPAGSVVAIVGDNGAGKSTLVKLLCRFYEPSAGRIKVDGVALAEFDPRQWRARTSAGFQDFVRLEALAQESIGVGDLPRIGDVCAAWNAVTRADAGAVVDRLPQGLRSHLGRAYADGEELSGGQWQRIALSRAMMRDDPLLMVLDEPTSALDPLAEHALFERYAASAREVSRRGGGITVLVSHRFSTVRMADLVVVISGGRIAELGSHEDLIRANGIYRELYAVQAATYA